MDNFMARWGRHKRESTSAVPSSTTDTTADVHAADYEERVVHPHGRRSLLVPAWYRGVSLIMQTMGQMEMQYQRMNREGGNFVEDRYGAGRRLNYLLQVRPCPALTGSQLLEQVEFRKIYYGNAYVYIERDATGDPAALHLCTDGSYLPGEDRYLLTYNVAGVARSVVAPSADVLHFKNTFLSDDMTRGLPTVTFAMTALSIAATADGQTLKDMAKGGKHKLLIQEKDQQGANWGVTAAGMVDQTEGKGMAAQIGSEYLSQDAVFLPKIADVKIISQTAAELRTLENRGFEVAELSRLLGIPTIMMMLDTGNNYKTPEAATQEFLLRTIQPRIREMEDELNSKLLDPDDFGRRRIHVCEQALRRLDPSGQANLDKIHLETGAMNVNEIRAQYDLPAVKGGDDFYVSTNLALLGSDKLKSSGAGRPPVDDTAGQQDDTNGNEEDDA